MKIMAIEKGLKAIPPDLRDDILKREAAEAWRLQQETAIREIYLTDNRSKAVIIMECQDEAEAARLLARLPLVAEGFISFTCNRLEPYPGYARLFEGSA